MAKCAFTMADATATAPTPIAAAAAPRTGASTSAPAGAETPRASHRRPPVTTAVKRSAGSGRSAPTIASGIATRA